MHNHKEDGGSNRAGPAGRVLRYLAPLLNLGLVAVLLGACHAKNEPAEKAEGKEGKEAPTETRTKQSTNGQPMVVLNADTQQRMGLQTQQLEPASVAPARIAYGRVLDFAPLVTLVAEQTTAKATLAASEAELNRLRTLAPGGNASERALQAAQAATARDQAQFQSVNLHLLASWGKAIADREDLVEFVKSLASISNALVELSVPGGEALPGMPLSAQITPSGETNSLDASLLGAATSVDPSLQGRSFRFLVAQSADKLFPGRAVSGWILFPGEKMEGALLPDAALVRHEGSAWVYVRAGDKNFERTRVELERRLEGGWFARSPKPGTAVVTTGAQQLLSEELKGQGGEE